MIEILSQLNWNRTSRNTEISVGEVDSVGKVFFKRSSLINANNINLHINSFEILNSITKKIDGADSPLVIKELCNKNIIALEFISESSFHDLWKDKDYLDSKILSDVNLLFFWLNAFHNSTIEDKNDNPLCYVDFGPKNLIPLSKKSVMFIDPPIEFTRKKAYFDFGTLVFEIERSMIQTSRFNLLFKIRSIAKNWVMSSKNNDIYRLYINGINNHVLVVFKRYLQFYKKPKPLFELLRGFLIIPLLIIYIILFNIYELFNRAKYFK